MSVKKGKDSEISIHEPTQSVSQISPASSLNLSEETDSKEIEQASSFGTRLLASSGFGKYTILFTTVLIFGAVSMSVVCKLNSTRTDETEEKQMRSLLQAVSDIRDYLISRNISNFLKSDPEILEEATQEMDILYTLTKRNSWAARQIKRIVDLMENGWKPFEGSLYFFSTPDKPHDAAKVDCINREAVMVIITNPEEETFIEESVRDIDKSYWIALHKIKVGNKEEWRWVNGEKPDVTYWAAGQPGSSQPGPYCAEIPRLCHSKHKCWAQIPCSSFRRWICKMGPHPELIL